jgi:DNA replication and repair protein RecF
MRFGASYLSVEGIFEQSGQMFKVHGAWRPGEKGFRCDGKAYDRLSDHIGRFPAVMIAPVDINLIHEGSEQRRRLMDLTLSQEDPDYLEDLSCYNRLLRQKLYVLRGWQSTGLGDEHLLRVLTEQMQPLNNRIFLRRSQWAREMASLFIEHYRHISGGHEVPSLEYKSGWPFVCENAGSNDQKSPPNPYTEKEPNSAEFFNTQLIDKARSDSEKSSSKDPVPALEPVITERMLQQEKSSGRCLWGIHRDDLQFMLDGHLLKPHASQGQQKTYVISLKLAQSKLIRKASGNQPLLLLDDVFEKLDEQRVAALLERVSSEPNQQIFLTHTEENRVRSLLGSKTDVRFISL